MRIMSAALAVGTAMALSQPAPSAARVVRQPAQRLVVTPEVRPYWDSYIVPRYRYRPKDDRVDPYGPPVVPVVRYGDQEYYLPRGWWGWGW